MYPENHILHSTLKQTVVSHLSWNQQTYWITNLTRTKLCFSSFNLPLFLVSNQLMDIRVPPFYSTSLSLTFIPLSAVQLHKNGVLISFPWYRCVTGIQMVICSCQLNIWHAGHCLAPIFNHYVASRCQILVWRSHTQTEIKRAELYAFCHSHTPTFKVDETRFIIRVERNFARDFFTRYQWFS